MQVSTLGCRIKLRKDLDPTTQGNVGLYARRQAPFSEASTCAALVKYTTTQMLLPDGSKRDIETRSYLSSRFVPSVTVSTTQKSWGCPCYSNVLFDQTGRSRDPSRHEHCSEALFFNNEMPLASGESVPLVGNRFIALEGSLSDISEVLSNITYLPDPYFNTRIPGQSDEIIIEIDDGGGLGDAQKDPETGQIIPPPPKKARKVIKVNVESVNDAPQIGRRIVPQCEAKYSDRKMHCPAGANDPSTRNLQRLQTWTQVDNWPDTNLVTETLATAINVSVDFIDVDEDSIFAITPDVLWVVDPDSTEAEKISDISCVSEGGPSNPLQCEMDPGCKINCADPFGVYLVNSYRCRHTTGADGSVVGDAGNAEGSKCSPDAAVNNCNDGQCVQQAGTVFNTQSNPGDLLIEMSVGHGKLSFYPPPPQFPRTLSPKYTVPTRSPLASDLRTLKIDRSLCELCRC